MRGCARTISALSALAAGSVLAYARVLLPWHVRWGAREEEVRMPMPGDAIAPVPTMASTRAISVRAAPEAVWQWLVQLGQGRGGMFSYDWLENVLGSDIHTLKGVRPELQHLEIGDKIRLGPEGRPFFRVDRVLPAKELVLHAADPQTGNPVPASWAFVLLPENGHTRLISRQRNQFEPTVTNFLIWRVLTEPISFVMEQKMLRTLKALAEGR